MIFQRLMLPGAECRLIEMQSGSGEGSVALAPRIDGYAARFNVLSEDLGGWRERIAPGAFSRSIAARDDVRALHNHDPNHVLGRTTAGTLRLREDDAGLVNEMDPPDTSWFRDLKLSMGRKDVNQQSFGMYAKGYSWAKEDGVLIRTVREAQLFDVSVVTFPAYPQTNAQLRSMVFETLPMELRTDAHLIVEAQQRAMKYRIKRIEMDLDA